MLITTSKNKSFICVEELCDDRVVSCPGCNPPVEQQAHPLTEVLRDLWKDIRLFFESNKWDPIVTLKVGDSHYTMKMDDIESRWRDP